MIYSVAIEKPQDLLGSIVISKCGRDRGRPCVILGWLPGDFALIADGRLRTVEKPKKKNMKHLLFTQSYSGDLGMKFSAGERVTDRMIREELAAFAGCAGDGRKRA